MNDLQAEIDSLKERLKLSAEDRLRLFKRIDELLKTTEGSMSSYRVYATLQIRGMDANLNFIQQADNIVDAAADAQKLLTSNFDQSYQVVIWSIEQEEEEEEVWTEENIAEAKTLGDILGGGKP